jgi:hypothetical protein
MKNQFTKDDLHFLAAVGIASDEGTALDADRLVLAKRIAKHRAPIQVPVAPDAARLALIRLALKRLLAASKDQGMGTLSELAQQMAQSPQELSPAQQGQLRKEIYERVTKKPYRERKP